MLFSFVFEACKSDTCFVRVVIVWLAFTKSALTLAHGSVGGVGGGGGVVSNGTLNALQIPLAIPLQTLSVSAKITESWASCPTPHSIRTQGVLAESSAHI